MRGERKRDVGMKKRKKDEGVKRRGRKREKEYERVREGNKIEEKERGGGGDR